MQHRVHRADVRHVPASGDRRAERDRLSDGDRDLERSRDGHDPALVGGAPVLLPGWDVDALGLALARIAVAAFVAKGRAVTVAVDDTLFHRYGRKVFGVFWQNDGSAKGRDGIGRGNCFVVAGLVVTAPFTDRNVFLPLLFRLHRPKHGASKPEQARQLAYLLAGASRPGACMWWRTTPTAARPGGVCLPPSRSPPAWRPTPPSTRRAHHAPADADAPP